MPSQYGASQRVPNQAPFLPGKSPAQKAQAAKAAARVPLPASLTPAGFGFTAPPPVEPAGPARLAPGPGKMDFGKAVAAVKVEAARLKAAQPARHLPDWAWQQMAVHTLFSPGPSGDAGSQLSSGDLATARQVGVRPTVAGQALAATLHPAVDLAQGLVGQRSLGLGGALSDVANLASNVVSPEKAVGVAALFGARGLRGAKAVEDVAGAAKAANATEAAVRLAQKHGVPLDQIAGTGRKGLVTAGDVRSAHYQSLSPQGQLKTGLKAARSQYGVEKAARSQEATRRAQEVAKAYATIADPREAHAAASQAMRGEMPKIDFGGLKELNPQSLKTLMTHVQTHPSLLPFQKKNLNDALIAAVEKGRVPRPHEMRLIEHVFGKQTALGVTQVASQGLGSKIINALNIPRSLMATADLSGIGRQSLVAGASHPIIWGKNFPTAFRAMASGNFYEASAQAIKDDPLYNLALAAKVSFTDLGEHSALAAHEEAFASDYAAQIPGVGHVVKGSARAYVGFLNKMRMDLFTNQIRIAQAAGRNIQDETFLRGIGDVINAATGRGTIHGSAEHLLPALNTFLFSPRLMLSRINYLDPTWYVRLPPQARREALRGLFATAGAVTGALYLFSRIPGVHVGSLDPRSADFGKLRVHNTRIDVAGGFQQYVRLASELATSTEVSSTTGKKTKLGSGFGIPTRWDVLTQFGVNKLSPAASMGVNVIRGHDAVGNPVTPQSIAVGNFTPLLLQDARDIYRENHGGVNGIGWALGGYGLGAFGVGLQTYKAKPVKVRPSSGATYGGGTSGGGATYGGGSGGGSQYGH